MTHLINSLNFGDKYGNRMLKKFCNRQHREETEEYLFIRERIDKVKTNTMTNVIQALLSLDMFLKDKPYEKTTQNDMLKWEQFLEKEYISPGRTERYEKAKANGNEEAHKPKKGLETQTIEQYEAHIKRFYKYLLNKEEYKKGRRFQKNIPYPDNVSWISSSSKNRKEFPIDNLLREEEFLKLLEACEIPRDKAMFSSGFYDAGLRISELISLNIRNVGFDKLGGYFILPKKGKDLKTGMRRIRLFIMPSSTKYLKDFLNNHPFKNYDDAPLFYSREFSRYNKIKDLINNKKIKKADWESVRLSRPGIENKLKKICKLAGLPIMTPHQLRHQSCTLCCKAGFNEMQLRIRYGWSPTSKMPSKYTHLASVDIDDKIKQITGFKEPEEPEISKLASILCWNCQEENVPTNKFCSKCGSNLNPSKEELTPTATETGLGIQEMMKDPEFMMQMMNMMAKKWAEMQKKK